SAATRCARSRPSRCAASACSNCEKRGVPMNRVTVLAPGKLNLTLDVTGVAENGYHTLDMIMQSVSLAERVIVRRSGELRLRLPGSFVPANESNTAYKAALVFFRETGLLAGADITVKKAVPVRSGMAGG